MAADDNGLQDWAADHDGEGRERMKKINIICFGKSPPITRPHP
jgi:hypothetical protein